MTKFARELERELVGVILQRDTAQATLRDMTKRTFDDQTAADARWNKLRDERDEARNIAAELRDLVPWSESDPWNFSWENDPVDTTAEKKA